MIKIALSKGRLLKESLPILAKIGIAPLDDVDSSRKLILDSQNDDVKLVILRASDVPTYVQYGAADIGIAGKDVLLEHGGEGLYEPVDLGIGRCRLMVAGLPDVSLPFGPLRIATKYVNTARRYFNDNAIQVEVIKLYGSMELAPLVGLADRIVDVVDTGNTLKANGLVAMETIATISSRLIVNRAAMKLKHVTVRAMVEAFRDAVVDHPVHCP